MLGSMIPLRRRFPGTFGRFENEFERFWDPVDRLLSQEDWDVAMQRVFPLVNVVETDDAFEVTVELPGMKAKDVHVEFQNGALLIFGEKKAVEKEKGWKFLRVESAYGQFNRRIELPGMVDEGAIKAEFEDGELNVFVPKSEEVKAKHIKITAH